MKGIRKHEYKRSKLQSSAELFTSNRGKTTLFRELQQRINLFGGNQNA